MAPRLLDQETLPRSISPIAFLTGRKDVHLVLAVQPRQGNEQPEKGDSNGRAHHAAGDPLGPSQYRSGKGNFEFLKIHKIFGFHSNGKPSKSLPTRRAWTQSTHWICYRKMVLTLFGRWRPKATLSFCWRIFSGCSTVCCGWAPFCA